MLGAIPDNCVDAVVTDPPYGLTSVVKRFGKKGSAPAKHGTDGAFARASKGFMGKEWDGSGVEYSPKLWEEVYRVLKPGGHVLSFGGTRTYHRMAVAIEDAGFEIRDMVAWLYGSGFPKSLDVSKALDKAAGAEREVVGYHDVARRNTRDNLESLRDGLGAMCGKGAIRSREEAAAVTASATEDAAKWDGWGTALKPSHEPICLARKPLSEKSVAANVLRWGTGALAIDLSRVRTAERITNHARSAEAAISKGIYGDSREQETHQTQGQAHGRWPANLILDEEAARMLDEQSGERKSGGGNKNVRNHDDNAVFGKGLGAGNGGGIGGDTGGSSRFFAQCNWSEEEITRFAYIAKPSKWEKEQGCGGEPVEVRTGCGGGEVPIDDQGHERNRFRKKARNVHPTVKPIALMRYLIRLVTPPGGLVLDPFLGSGTTLCAIGVLRAEGCEVAGVGIEKDPEYMEIARQRVAWYNQEENAKAWLKKVGKR